MIVELESLVMYAFHLSVDEWPARLLVSALSDKFCRSQSDVHCVNEGQRIEPGVLLSAIKDVQILDVRPQAQFDAFHLPGKMICLAVCAVASDLLSRMVNLRLAIQRNPSKHDVCRLHSSTI